MMTGGWVTASIMRQPRMRTLQTDPFHLGLFLQGSSVQAWGEPWTGRVGESWMQPKLFIDVAQALERACFDYRRKLRRRSGPANRHWSRGSWTTRAWSAETNRRFQEGIDA